MLLCLVWSLLWLQKQQIYCNVTVLFVEIMVVTATVVIMKCYCVVFEVYCCNKNISYNSMELGFVWSKLWLV